MQCVFPYQKIRAALSPHQKKYEYSIMVMESVSVDRTCITRADVYCIKRKFQMKMETISSTTELEARDL